MLRFFTYFSLLIKNWWSHAPITDPSTEVVVTLTSHGGRLLQAFAAIESIGCGTLRPARVILYLNEKTTQTELPSSLKKLATRGLEIAYCEDVGPHTKYYPYLMAEPRLDMPLVTADDDKLYGKDWLKKLVGRWKDQPELIHCYRAREIKIGAHGIEPYWTWPECESDQASLLHFATGVSGVIYPPAFQKILKQAGDEFRELCPKADDIWLHVMALRHGYPVRQIESRSVEYPGIPGSSRYALRRTNVDGYGNDQQITRTYLPDDIRRLRDIAAQS